MTRRRTLAAGLALTASLAYAMPAEAQEVSRPGYVVNTDGANLRVRAAPDATASILKRLGPGWLLTVLGEPSADGRWLRVEHGGTTGYVAAEYVAEGGTAHPAAPTPTVARRGSLPAGWVTNSDGANVRMRATPSTEATIIKRLAPGWRVTILDGPLTGVDGAAWVRVEHAGASGYVAAAYIAGAAAGGGEATPPLTPAPAKAAPAPPAPTERRMIAREPTRLRAEPDLGAQVIMRLSAGVPIELTGREVRADGYRWLGVRALGREGWAVADVLGVAPGRESGTQLAAEALAQVGRPYVWGGETPEGGFDCSGLVRYVVKRVTGIDLTHVLALQAEAGSPVERDQLQVGDLVFHRDTYKPGLSHVGFYVGDGQFVSAQNEKVGIVRARLATPYWGTRYFGARRLAV